MRQDKEVKYLIFKKNDCTFAFNFTIYDRGLLLFLVFVRPPTFAVKIFLNYYTHPETVVNLISTFPLLIKFRSNCYLTT